ncbi:hypothetical protein NP493_1601g00026 [Ridgeia piscesae]|uniref:Uncharacterized protein n=1 Tax=Ridgeia piscesae TaxID=27915 RepID=A0AAD9N8V2_RIDPI|nr:hypothetical protein NP493_1601g00026 [Ridgeia piscesae]
MTNLYKGISCKATYSNNLKTVWPLKNANNFLVTFVEILTISYQVCSISTTSIGHQTKYVVSLTVSMCLIKQRTQRSQRYVVLLRKPRNSMFMNDGKTQYLPIVPKYADAIVDKSVIRVGEATITASLCVQCLGVCIDRHIDMKKQVSQTISACSFYLRNINHITAFLPDRQRNALSMPLIYHITA